MTQNDDLRAIARLLALIVSDGQEDRADDALEWAYKEEKADMEEARTEAVRQTGPRVEYGGVVNLWNFTMTRGIPKVRDLSGNRREKVRQRVVEMGGWPLALKQMAAGFRKLNDSDFCNGKTGWTASFDWFFANGTNWRKVLEGNYDNRKEKSAIDTLGENIAKADAYYEQRFGKPAAGSHGNPAGGREDGPDEQ